MWSVQSCASALRWRALFCTAAAVLWLSCGAPAWAILFGSPLATSGQVRLEVVPLGVDDQTPKFSDTLDGKLRFETNSIGSGGHGGWPRLGAPAIVPGSDTGVGALPIFGSASATSSFGGGSMGMSVVASAPGVVGLTWNGTVSDAGPDGFASVATGFATGTWTNVGDQPEGIPLDMLVVLSQIVVVPAGGLTEIGLAGDSIIAFPPFPTGAAHEGHKYAIVAGIDNSGGRINIIYGTEDGTSILGPSGFSLTQIAPTTYRLSGWMHYGEVISDQQLLTYRGNLTLAMDPAVGSFVRPGPVPSGVPPVTAGGLSAYASEAPDSSTEWTNSIGTADFNIAGNWSAGSPTSSSLVAGCAERRGKMPSRSSIWSATIEASC